MARKRRLLKPAPVEQVADRGRARAKRAFLAAIAAQRQGIRSPDDALTSEPQLHRVVEAVTRVYWAAGQLAGEHLRVALQPAKALPAGVRRGLDFTRANKKAAAWARKNGARLIADTNRGAKAAMRRIIAQGLSDGLRPDKMAELIRWHVGLTQTQGERALKYRAGLIAEGRDADQVARMAKRYTDKLLTARAESIAQNETYRAALGGQEQLWIQARDEGELPPETERQWIAEGDNPCDVCTDLDGTTAPLDEPFEGGYDGPPAHTGCLCVEGLFV